METNHRNPSKHRIEEHDMLNWLKANRKKVNAGDLKEPRLGGLKSYWGCAKSTRERTNINKTSVNFLIVLIKNCTFVLYRDY